MEWIAVIVVVALALASKGGNVFGGGDKPLPGGGGGTDPKLPGGGGGGGKKPGGGGGGGGGGAVIKTWGTIAKLPDWFRVDGNSFWVSPNCDAVAEGQWFLPTDELVKTSGKGMNAIEEPTLAETLAAKLPPGSSPNTVWGFIDYLIDVEGFQSPDAIAFRILQEAAPLCADVPMAQWSPPLRSWHADFSDRISQRVYESVGGIDFGGDG